MIAHYTTFSFFDCFTLNILQMKRYRVLAFNHSGEFITVMDEFYTVDEAIDCLSYIYEYDKDYGIEELKHVYKIEEYDYDINEILEMMF